MTQVNVTIVEDRAGYEMHISDEPHAAHQKNCWGLRNATDNATYRGVKFGRKLQAELGYMVIVPYSGDVWRPLIESGGGVVEVDDAVLAELARRSAEIDRIVATAVPSETYRCAGHKDGCGQRVRVRGDYCPSCAFDEFDN
jgi:hypothetical protein